MAEKILIVDDDLETLRLVGVMLQRQGYEIVAASSGAQALQKATQELPDLIILDVMMPDMDGYRVTQQLRNQDKTSTIPILMFTAKSGVEDKVSGYEAGVDDYLTKPIHPVELSAHVKALLARGKGRAASAPVPTHKAYTIAVLGARGGLGMSAFTLNLALSYFKETKSDVIAAELSNGHGSWAYDLGFANQDGLNHLLALEESKVTAMAVEQALTRTTHGIRLLMASNQLQDVNLGSCSKNAHLIVRHMQSLASVVFLDIGTNITPDYREVLASCDEAMILTEPFPATVMRTKNFIEQLQPLGFGNSKIISIILNHRVRADVQLSANQVEDLLGQPVAVVLPPAPELAYQAGLRASPLILIMPEGLLAQQFERFAKALGKRVKQ